MPRKPANPTKATRKPKQPPFAIPLLPPQDQLPASFDRSQLWDALEFFRVEALLRSHSAWELYRRADRRQSPKACSDEDRERWQQLQRHVVKEKSNAHAAVPPILSDHTLRGNLFIDDGWLVLWGAHYRYLRPDPWLKPSERPQDGILDLSALARDGQVNWDALQKNMRSNQNLYLYLKINCAVAPGPILDTLRPLLESRHQAITVNLGKPNIDPETGEHTFPFHPRKDPPITDIAAWMKYFQCYDLKHYQELTLGAIAHIVYEASDATSEATSKVAKAVRRVTNLIEAAEKNNWPPPPPR